MSIARYLRQRIAGIVRMAYVNYFRAMGVQIGDDTMISVGAWLDCYKGKLIIGNGCRITSGVKILSHDQTISRIFLDKDPDKDIAGVTVIEDRVFIGMNAIVLPNVTIGRNSIVGAGTVVSKNVPPDTIVIGNPMRFIKKFDKASQQWVPYGADELTQEDRQAK